PWAGAVQCPPRLPVARTGLLAAPEERVVVRPSTMELVATGPLRWMLTRSGGQPADSAAQSLGNLIHEIAAARPHGTRQELRGDLEARWHELDLPVGWGAAGQRRSAEDRGG